MLRWRIRLRGNKMSGRRLEGGGFGGFRRVGTLGSKASGLRFYKYRGPAPSNAFMGGVRPDPGMKGLSPSACEHGRTSDRRLSVENLSPITR